jgi:hypothetical protein
VGLSSGADCIISMGRVQLCRTFLCEKGIIQESQSVLFYIWLLSTEPARTWPRSEYYLCCKARDWPLGLVSPLCHSQAQAPENLYTIPPTDYCSCFSVILFTIRHTTFVIEF